MTNQNVHSLQQRQGKSQSPLRWWWAPFYLLIRKECLSYVQWYYSTVEFHSLLYKLYKSRSRLSDFNHSICSYSYRPRRSFLSCLRRIWARSRLGPWCAKPCQVSACLPLSIWCLTSSPWRDATFTIGTVVGRPWAHWKHRDVAFSSSIIRQHSDGSKGSPNMIAPLQALKLRIRRTAGGIADDPSVSSSCWINSMRSFPVKLTPKIHGTATRVTRRVCLLRIFMFFLNDSEELLPLLMIQPHFRICSAYFWNNWNPVSGRDWFFFLASAVLNAAY